MTTDQGNFKPTGYTSVSPYLVVNDADAMLSFLREAFGAETLRSFKRDDGSTAHAEVRIDDTIVMLGRPPDGESPTSNAHIHVYVTDVEKTYERALGASATPVQEPAQSDDEDMRGGVRDFAGTTWWISTRVG